MGDETLNDLQQRWRDSGASSDEIAYRRALAGSSEAEADRLLLAAELGHVAALRALDRSGEPGTSRQDLRDWILGLERWGILASVRVLIESAKLLMSPEEPKGSPAFRAIRVAEALLACPCDVHEKAARTFWTQHADWAVEIPWAELSAEVAWKAHWKTSEEAVREAIGARLLPWALGDEGPPLEWDAEGTGGDLPSPRTHDGSH